MVRKRKQFTPQSNVVVNGRSVVHQGSGATITSTSINYTGKKKKPVAYTNVAKSEDLVGGCDSFTVNGNPVALIDSKISKSSGDEAGDGGGIYSGTVNGECTFLTGSIEVTAARSNGVLVNGKAIVRHGDLAISNGGNCPPTPIEQAPADSPAIQQHAYKLAPPEEPSDYSLSVMIHGPDNFVRNSFIGLWHQDEENDGQWQDFWMQSVDNEANSQLFGNTRRLSFHNLPPEKTMLSIERYSVDGEHFMIPLDYAIAWPYQRCGTPSVMTIYHDEETYLLQTQFVSQLGKEGDKDWQNDFAQSPEDFSDIWRLSSHTRQLVYDFLIHYQLSPEQALLASERKAYKDSPKPNQSVYTYRQYGDGSNIDSLTALEKSWYQLLPPELKEIVDTELSKRKPLNPGWLYLYANGFLWREIRIDEAGQYSDVDLARYAGETLRLATGMADNAVILPYRVNNTPIELEVLFCPEQLSWDRINYFGGMDPHDKRLIHSRIEPWHSDKNKAKQARAKYLTPLDLKPAVKQFTMPLANVKKDHGLSLFETLDRIPVITLPESLTVVDNATNDVHALYQELNSLARALMQHDNNEYFLTALMSYRYFFDERIAEATKVRSKEFTEIFNRTLPKFQTGMAAGRDSYLKPKGSLADCQDNFDRDRIECDLQVAKRQRIRELIFMLQKNLVSFVSEDNQVNSNNPLRQRLSTTFDQEIEHLFSQRLHQLKPAAEKVDALVATLRIKGQGADANLSVNDDKFDYHPIYQYFDELMQPDNKLMSFILPHNEKAIDYDKWKHLNWMSEHKDNPRPTAKIKPEEFAFIWNSVEMPIPGSSITTIWESIFNIVKNCVENSAEHMLSGNKHYQFMRKTISATVNRVVINASEFKTQEGQLNFSNGEVDLHHRVVGFKQFNGKASGEVINIDYAKEVSQHKVAKGTRFTHELFTNEKLPPKLSHLLKQPDGRQLLVSYQSAIDESTVYQQVKQSLIYKDENTKLYAKQNHEIYQRIYKQKDLITISEDSINEIKPSLAQKAGYATHAAFTGLMILATWANMIAVFDENKKNQSASPWDDLNLVKSILEATYSLEIMAEAIWNKEAVKKLQNQFIRTGSLWSALRHEADASLIPAKSATNEHLADFFKHMNNSPMKFIGLAGASFSFIVSIHEMYESFAKHDIAGGTMRFGSALVAGADLTTISSLIAENYITGKIKTEFATIFAEKTAQGYLEEEILALATDSVLSESSAAIALLSETIAPIFAKSWVTGGILSLSILFALAYEGLKDSELESWTKNNPYSKSPEKKQLDIDYAAELEQCFNKPRLSFKNINKNYTRLTFNLTNYDPQIHRLELDIELVTCEHKTNSTLMSNSSHDFAKGSIKIKPLKEELYFNNQHSIPKIDYIIQHDLEQLSKKYDIPLYAIKVEIIVKYRLINDNDTFFPLHKKDGHYLCYDRIKKDPELNNDNSTWYIKQFKPKF